MKTAFIYLILLFCLAGTSSLLAASFIDTEDSFAEEYKNLRILLEKVQDKETALQHKQAIEKEIKHLSSNNQSGADQFNSLSAQEKELFVKKFQKNHFHCGDVTQVMAERNRILLNAELSIILNDTLSKIP